MLVIGIDGTGSEYFANDNDKYRLENQGSHVDNICKRTGGIYYRGPRVGGGGMQFTVNTVVRELIAWAGCYPSDSKELEIVLAGHSRGGLAAIMIANRLNLARQMRLPKPLLGTFTRGTVADIRIRCVALFDAVDRYAYENADSIPANVPYCYHAIRNPAVGSRQMFGNTARNVADSSATNYVERPFWVAHAGCGGTPWTGDHPELLVDSKKVVGGEMQITPTITEAQDKAGSAAVRAWMDGNLSSHGVFGGINLFEKGATDLFARSQRVA